MSGATDADEDRELAEIGARSIQAAIAARANGSANGAAYFPAEAVDEKFRDGGLLLDEAGYKIDAGRREGPGEVEYHEHVVDVMHVVSGRATVITGGSMVDAARGRAGRAARRGRRGRQARTSSARATCSRSRTACLTSSPTSRTRSCTSW